VSITVNKVSKSFGTFRALDNVSLEVPSGCLVALLGPSGSGKTTLLRVIAGLETADEGAVLYKDEEVTDTPVQHRQVGFVFQHYALFRHMSVFENIAFGMRVRKWPSSKIQQRVTELIHLIRLEGLDQRYPSQLSGGQRQRVALARALASEPRVLLLDEPFGALDAKVRLELRQWLRRLHDQIHLTSIFVTHDQEDAFAVSDKVVVMRQGKIEQIGPPVELFENPANAFVMDFLGHVNAFKGQLKDGRIFLTDYVMHSSQGKFNEQGIVYVRPHELEIKGVNDHFGSLPAIVDHLHPSGSCIRVHLRSPCGQASCCVEINTDQLGVFPINVGDKVCIHPKRGRIFDQDYNI